MQEPEHTESPATGAPIYDFSILRVLRKREGLTIGEVAERSGVSTAVISKLERNQTSAELETIYKLGRVFGMSAGDLIGLAESRMAQPTKSSQYTFDGFQINKISYNNADCLLATAPKDARISRPEVHSDDFEICWVLEGAVAISLPSERKVINAGQAIQFDAILDHTYEALDDLKMIIMHIRKDNRF